MCVRVRMLPTGKDGWKQPENASTIDFQAEILGFWISVKGKFGKYAGEQKKKKKLGSCLVRCRAFKPSPRSSFKPSPWVWVPDKGKFGNKLRKGKTSDILVVVEDAWRQRVLNVEARQSRSRHKRDCVRRQERVGKRRGFS